MLDLSSQMARMVPSPSNGPHLQAPLHFDASTLQPSIGASGLPAGLPRRAITQEMALNEVLGNIAPASMGPPFASEPQPLPSQSNGNSAGQFMDRPHVQHQPIAQAPALQGMYTMAPVDVDPSLEGAPPPKRRQVPREPDEAESTPPFFSSGQMAHVEPPNDFHLPADPPAHQDSQGMLPGARVHQQPWPPAPTPDLAADRRSQADGQPAAGQMGWMPPSIATLSAACPPVSAAQVPYATTAVDLPAREQDSAVPTPPPAGPQYAGRFRLRGPISSSTTAPLQPLLPPAGPQEVEVVVRSQVLPSPTIRDQISSRMAPAEQQREEAFRGPIAQPGKVRNPTADFLEPEQPSLDNETMQLGVRPQQPANWLPIADRPAPATLPPVSSAAARPHSSCLTGRVRTASSHADPAVTPELHADKAAASSAASGPSRLEPDDEAPAAGASGAPTSKPLRKTVSWRENALFDERHELMQRAGKLHEMSLDLRKWLSQHGVLMPSDRSPEDPQVKAMQYSLTLL